MKKFYFLTVAITLLCMTSCTSDDIDNGGDKNSNVEVVASKTIKVGDNGAVTFGKSEVTSKFISEEGLRSRTTSTTTNVPCFGDDEHTAHANIPINTVVLDDVDVTGLAKLFCAEFVEKRANLTFDHPDLSNMTTDFNYISNGLPIQVMLLYTGTASDTKLHIYYYDKDTHEFHVQQIWAMDSNWKKSNEKETFQNLARINQDKKAWEFTLPKGTEWGLMMRGISSSRETKNKIEYHYTREEENLMHPCEAIPVVNFPSAVQFTIEGETYEGTFKGEPYTIDSSMYEGKTFIGFNNQFGSDTDYDYNDMIIMVTPTPEVKDYTRPDIDIEIGDAIDVDFTCASDDTNIRIAVDKEHLMKPIGQIDNTTFKLRLEKGERFKLSVVNLAEFEDYWMETDEDTEELVFDLRMYNYDAAIGIDKVKKLFGVPEDATPDETMTYINDLEIPIDENYWGKVNVAITELYDGTPNKDNQTNKIHISLIIYRRKTVE